MHHEYQREPSQFGTTFQAVHQREPVKYQTSTNVNQKVKLLIDKVGFRANALKTRV